MSRTQMRIGKKVMPMFVLRFRFWTQRFLRRRALACVAKLAGPLGESMAWGGAAGGGAAGEGGAVEA